MSNDINITTTPNIEVTTTYPPLSDDKIVTTNIFAFVQSVFMFFMTRFFLLCFGIFIGVGVVVKFSPETNNLKTQIKTLQDENNKLKILLKTNNSNWGELKDSFILKK